MSDKYGTLDEILSELASPDPMRRHHAAHRIKDFAEAAVNALFQAIARPDTGGYRGTLVYILRAFRCDSQFTELFDLALNDDYEVQNHALSILQSQSFDVTSEQLHQAEQALDELHERENLSGEDVDLLRKDLRIVLSQLSESQDGAT